MFVKLSFALVLLSATAIYLTQTANVEFSNGDANYTVVNEKKKWEEALTYCQGINQSLVALDSQTKLVSLSMYLMRDHFIISKLLKTTDFIYWTSGNNRKDPSHFVWESTGKPIEYFHWSSVLTPLKSGCIQMGAGGFGRWQNATCDTPNYFICELQKVAPV